MYRVPVHIFLADPDLGTTVRRLLSLSPMFRVAARKTKACEAHDNSDDWQSFSIDDSAAATETTVLLFGPDELLQYGKAFPEHTDLTRGTTKIVLILRSDEVRESLPLLRYCDGMIVSDANLTRAADIIGFALHGYFVIPRHLMSNFNLSSAALRSAMFDQIAARQRQDAGPESGQLRDDAVDEYVASKMTVNKALCGALPQTGARPLRAEAPTSSDKAPEAGSDRAVSLIAWRRAFRNNDGRVSTLEYTLFLALLAVWSAIFIEGRVFRGTPPHCPIAAPASYCQLEAMSKRSSIVAKDVVPLRQD